MPAEVINIRDLKILGQTTPIGLDVRATGIYANPSGSYLWLALPYAERGLRVRIPTSGNEYIIYTIIN